ncbi:hypothetical protein LGT39_00815, partial [Demequina sp. TTPB684]|uniref:hypothetical protein n=1 Tax=Demequina sp. TTPB684 TaxID=2881057 RepID=UPI001CF127A4
GLVRAAVATPRNGADQHERWVPADDADGDPDSLPPLRARGAAHGAGFGKQMVLGIAAPWGGRSATA